MVIYQKASDIEVLQAHTYLADQVAETLMDQASTQDDKSLVLGGYALVSLLLTERCPDEQADGIFAEGLVLTNLSDQKIQSLTRTYAIPRKFAEAASLGFVPVGREPEGIKRKRNSAAIDIDEAKFIRGIVAKRGV